MAYIERESAIKSLLNDCLGQVSYSREDAADCIFWLDTADVAPVRHGRWKRIGENHEKCTHCGYIFEALPSQYFFEMNNKFCRMCGAKMDLED